MKYVKGSANPADQLTRIPEKWLVKFKQKTDESEEKPTFAAPAISTRDRRLELIRYQHEDHHRGVEKTLALCRLLKPELEATREEVKEVIDNCQQCRRINPTSLQWKSEGLEVDRVWQRAATDITHWGRELYLTIIDCGPSRFAIWRQIADGSIEEVGRQMREVFMTVGPPGELMSDNGTTFHSRQLAGLCEFWGVRQHFTSAYRPNTNGIIERHHATIKTILATRGGGYKDKPILQIFRQETEVQMGTNNCYWSGTTI